MSQGSDFIELTGLWENTTKAGKTYLKGYMGQAQVFVFFNEAKSSDKAPSARLVIAPKQERNQYQGNGQSNGYQNGQSGSYQGDQGNVFQGQREGYSSPEQRRQQTQQTPQIPVNEDDLPF